MSFMPYLIPSIAFGSIFLALFGVPRGPIPGLYGTFALLVLACVVKSLPYSTRSGIGAMMQIGPELEEAGVMVGASWVQRLKRIILPLQKGPFFSGLLLPFISAMRAQLSSSACSARYAARYNDHHTLHRAGLTAYANGIMILIVRSAYSGICESKTTRYGPCEGHRRLSVCQNCSKISRNTLGLSKLSIT